MTRVQSGVVQDRIRSLFLVSFCLYWFSDTVVDPDLWGHIRFGQDIRRAGSIVQTDTYSYRTAGQPWINHEWLSEVIFAEIYGRSGPRGLIVFKVLISLLIFGLCWNHLRRRGLGPIGSLFLLVLASIPFRMGLGTIRPQLFTYLLFLIELLLLERTARGHEFRLWVLPFLFAAWVNLHGGVLAGVGVLGIWIVVRIIERLRDGRISRIGKLTGLVSLSLLGIICGLALLPNPYGAELIRFLLRTATVTRPEIGEWTPLGLTSFAGRIYLVLLAIGIFGLVGCSRCPRPEAILIFGVAAVLPLISQRHYPLFLLTLIVLAGESIAGAAKRLCPADGLRLGPSRVIASIGLGSSLALIALSVPRFACIRIDSSLFPFPARAVALLNLGGVAGDMAVPFDWGEYVIWHLGPRVKVSIDGRRETLYSEGAYQQSRDFATGTGAWDALLKTGLPTDLVLAPLGSPTANLLARTTGWQPLYKDTYCVIFTREGFLDLERLAEIPIPALPDNGDNLCFPIRSRAR